MKRMTSNESSPVLMHQPCLSCGSSDALTSYDDGHTYCFSCGEYSDDNKEDTEMSSELLDVIYVDLHKRGIPADICRKYGYGLADYRGGPWQAATFTKQGRPVSQHLRSKQKDFVWVNHQRGLEMFGQCLWQEGGKELIITEGEIDCLTWATTRNGSWPVVGITGAQAIQMVKDNLIWIASFEEVYLYFDEDEPGRKLTEAVAALLPPGKVRIGSTAPYKDSNELYTSLGKTELFNTKYQARVYRPAEIITASEVLTQSPKPVVLEYPWGLQEATGGVKEGDIGIICAGTNVGKSFISKHLAFHYLTQGKRVGFLALEETARDVLSFLLGLESGLPYDSLSLDEEKNYLDNSDWAGNIVFYSDTGENLSDVILPRIRYMMIAESVDVVFIDHITSVFTQTPGDERKFIDKFLTDLQSLCHETGVPVLAVSHLRDPSTGPTHNEGALPKLNQLRGSSMLSRVPASVLGVQRNTESPSEKHLTKLVCLKSRWKGLGVGESVTLTPGANGLLEVVDTEGISDDDDGDSFGF